MTGVSFPATQRAVEPVLVSALVLQPFHITPLSSIYPEFTHTGSSTAARFVVADELHLKYLLLTPQKMSQKN